MKKIWDQMWPELKVYKGRVLLALLLGALSSGLKALTPELLKRLITAWDNHEATLAYQIPLAITAVWTLSAVAKYFHLFGMKYIAELVAAHLRNRLMNKYMSLNLGFFQNFKSGAGGLISRMIADIQVIQIGVGRTADLLREPFMAIFTFAYLMYLDWKLVLFVIVALPLISLILKNLARSIRKYSLINQESMEQLTGTLKEALDGTRVVQSFNLEDRMREKFLDETNDYLKTRRKIIIREEAASPISESLVAIAQAGLMIYIGFLVLEKDFDTASFMGFIFAVGLFQDSIKKIQSGYIALQQSSVAMVRMDDILGQTKTTIDPVNPLPFPKNWQHIEFNNLSFRFGDNQVLKNINFRVKKGEVVALVGASGSGKSTLMNLLERFFDPEEGDILIGGTPISQIETQDLRQNIALVTQDVFLFRGTVRQNIHYGDLKKSDATIATSAELANAADFINNTPLKYDSFTGDGGHLFSGGERQRISIARAIFKDAAILILDEATSALDSKSELEVQKGLDQLLTGRTTFVIAHRLATIMNADRIFVLDKGEIVEAGTHQELIKNNSFYHQYYMLQTKI